MKKYFLTKNYTNIAILSIISFISILPSNQIVNAQQTEQYQQVSQDIPNIVISSSDNSISLFNIQENTIGVKVAIPVTSGDLSKIEFEIFDSNNEGFISYSSNMLIIYIANSSDLRTDDTTTINLGKLIGIDNINFSSSGGTITTSDFLFNETIYSNISIDIISNETGDLEQNNNNSNNPSADNSNSGSFNSNSSSSTSSSLGSASSNNSNITDEDKEDEDKEDEDKEIQEDQTLAEDTSSSTNNQGSSNDSLNDSTNSQEQPNYSIVLEQFTDVNGHWAFDKIGFVIHKEYFKGLSDNIFSPDTNMTRAMFVTVLSRLYGLEEQDVIYSNSVFQDLESNSWYTNAIYWAYENNITSGTSENTFSPYSDITREQMAKFLYNYTSEFNINLTVVNQKLDFNDNDDISSWAVEAIYTMQQAGILNGKPNNNFDPKGLATRAEVATMINNFCDILSNLDNNN